MKQLNLEKLQTSVVRYNWVEETEYFLADHQREKQNNHS